MYACVSRNTKNSAFLPAIDPQILKVFAAKKITALNISYTFLSNNISEGKMDLKWKCGGWLMFIVSLH